MILGSIMLYQKNKFREKYCFGWSTQMRHSDPFETKTKLKFQISVTVFTGTTNISNILLFLKTFFNYSFNKIPSTQNRQVFPPKTKQQNNVHILLTPTFCNGQVHSTVVAHGTINKISQNNFHFLHEIHNLHKHFIFKRYPLRYIQNKICYLTRLSK